jgi:hypothetical protein
MGIHDSFHFDKSEYEQKVASSSDQVLMQKDVTKCRQFFSASWSIGVGSAGAVASAGTSLLLSAYGARRMIVAMSKLEIIQSELLRRGIRPHDPTKRDYLIPIAVGIATLGFDVGADVFLSEMVNCPVPDAVMVPVPTGNSALEILASQPAEVVDGFVNGVAAHVAELQAAIVDVGNNDGVTSVVSAHAGHMLPFDPLTASAHALGEQAGQVGMVGVEKGLVSAGVGCLVNETLSKVMPAGHGGKGSKDA